MPRHPASVQEADVRGHVETLVRPGPPLPGVPGGWGRIGKDEATSARRMREMTEGAADGRDRPLLLSVNQEGGRLNALDWPDTVQLPGNAALGVAGSAELAELAGAVIGRQLRAVGLCWNLAPVCDLDTVPSTSAVSCRAFCADPVVAGRLAAAFVRGLQGARVAATAKHFPGLGGVVADPHQRTPVVERLAPGCLVPFEAVVGAGVASVMVGSHVVRELDSRPAFASARVIGLLRDGLGFRGVIVSENLSLPAVHGPLGGLAQAAVAAVASGVDVVMLDSEISRGRQGPRTADGMRRRSAVVEALTHAVLEGRIDPARITEAAGRVQALEGRFGWTPAKGRPRWRMANAQAAHAAGHVAGASVTVMRGQELLPLAGDGQVVTLIRVPDHGQRRADSARHAPDLLPELLAERTRVRAVQPGEPLPDDASTVVVYGYDTGPRPGGAGTAAAGTASRLAGGSVPVVQVAFGDPGDLAGSRAQVLVAAHSPHQASAAAVVDLLTQGRTAGGRQRWGGRTP